MKKYTSFGSISGAVANHYGVTVDLEKPTTGVIANGAIESLGDAMSDSDAIDLAWEEHISECKGICEHCECAHDASGDTCDCRNWDYTREPGSPYDEHAYCPDPDNHDGCGSQGLGFEYFAIGTVLIGSWKKGDDGKYEPDTTGEYSAIVGEIYTQVVWSKHVTRGAFCSPCFPGQVDIGSKGNVLAFTLPPGMMSE